MRAFAASSLVTLLAASDVPGQSPGPAPQPDRTALVARIDSLVGDYMDVRRAPAVSVAVLRGSDTLVMKGYGLASQETRRPATASTVYRIGSITKQFTSAAIMRLVEQGKLSLDDDLSKHVPDFPLQGHKVTIRQLLNHTSGIHSYTADSMWAKTWAQDLTPQQIVDFVARTPFDFTPGAGYRYNNTGYVLLGMVLEKVTGQPYAAHLQRELYTPLGLEQTSYCPSRPTDTTHAAGYDVQGDIVQPAPYLSMTHPYSAGALCSTVRDLVQWHRALTAGRVVSPASLARMTAPDTLGYSGPRLTYGYGLAPGQLQGKRSVGHGGGVHGFTSSSMYFPDDSVNVVVLTNSNGGPDPLAINIARAVFGMPLVPLPRPPVIVALADADRDRLPGVYDLSRLNGGVFTVHITIEQGRLMAQAEGPGQGKFPLLHLGNLRFGATMDPTLVLAFTAEGGRATKLQLTQRGNTIEGPRRQQDGG
ncbi:MAG TPA: serine hydrolase domain-containing protein [Gemmatimonadaceae bacterium]|nr:serine hydrolase domain-containing protein [Gemmatimonadaceae bacterium]